MPELEHNAKQCCYFFRREIWCRKVRVKLMTEDENQAHSVMPAVTEKIDRIDRNRDKIANLLYKGVYEEGSETVEEFSAALYISALRAEIYRDDGIEIIFTVKSKNDYPCSVKYECELHNDNSIEI